MLPISRRHFLASSLAAAATAACSTSLLAAGDPVPGERPVCDPTIQIENPLLRVPLSFIIDDSTCLVNLAHFAIPQFAQVYPDRYKQNWRQLPREIPDSFVRKFAGWCHERGIKGKYSIVPFPACVGRLDRELPGWTRGEQEASLQLVREMILPDWDIHPEMITHTWIIDTKTGHPFPERTEKFMENFRWADGRSVDEIAEYMAYGLKILKNVGLPCEGITTPGGFGNRVLPELSQAAFQSVRDVFGAEIPHYFRHLFTDDRSVAPRVEYAKGLNTDHPDCVVSIIGCTGDWFGGWDGLEPGHADQFITADGKGGRLPQVIAKGEPAILVCHWPGMYFNGDEVGLHIFQEVVARLNAHYDNLLWMKNSEIARYWAARELTATSRDNQRVTFQAPFACSRFTVRIRNLPPANSSVIQFQSEERTQQFPMVNRSGDLKTGHCWRHGDDLLVCFDLPKGRSELLMK